VASVSPYHTDSDEYPPSHRNVYHDRDDCKYGKDIKAEHRKSGIGNRPRCDECIDLDS